MKKVLLILLVCALWAHLPACKQPIAPELVSIEPDTAQATVSAIINGRLWTVKSFDTVSPVRILADLLLIRDDPWTWITDITANHNSQQSESYIFNAHFESFSVTSEEIRLPNGNLGVIRQLKGYYLNFGIFLPKNFTIPYIIKEDSLQSFIWQETKGSQSYVLTTQGPPGSGQPNSVSAYVFSTQFVNITFHYFMKNNPRFDDYDNSRVERASVRIERYDPIKRRVAGRFSFRLTNIKGQTVDIENGVFENVYLRIRN